MELQSSCLPVPSTPSLDGSVYLIIYLRGTADHMQIGEGEGIDQSARSSLSLFPLQQVPLAKHTDRSQDRSCTRSARFAHAHELQKAVRLD